MRMVSKATAALLVLSICGNAYGQDDRKDWQCQSVKAKLESIKNAAKTTVASPEEDKYDVKYVKLNLEMTNVATTLSGDVTTMAQVTASTMAGYVFELLPPLVVDSVLIDGTLQSVTSSGDVHTASLPSPMAMGTMFTAQVFYHGTPLSGTSSNIRGINTLRSPSWDNWATFTLSEPYGAKDWWPCKQSLKDKIDSADVWITVADSLKAGSIGLLQAVTPMGGGRSRYEWKERYPVVYYLISASVAKYVDYSYYMHFDGSADSMLIQNYVYDNSGTLPFFKNIIDSTDEQVNYFSSIFGRYPFWKEKYGHAMAPLSGGMEHQTMSTMGFFQSWLVAHELGHQWFGNSVTCATWADIVINEGFASYTEYLYADRFRGRAAATADIRDRQKTVMSQLGGSVYVDDTTDEGRIFSSRLSYDKGACVIHTLRHIINNDTYFFDLLRAWQTTMEDSTGTIEDFKNLTKTLLGSTINGTSVDTFFEQWFYGEGYPMYDVRWNQSGNNVFVQIDQRTSTPSSVPLFKVPLELRLRSTTGDTIIRVINDMATQAYSFTWNKTTTSFAIDPNNWLTDSLTSLMRQMNLGVAGFENTNISIYPNPTSTGWSIAGIPAHSELLLTDVTGKTIYTTSNGKESKLEIPASRLSTGLYMLHVRNSGNAGMVYKLVKE